VNRWTGPVIGLVVFLFLVQFGPRPEGCPEASVAADPPPLPAADPTLLELGASRTSPRLVEVADPFALEAAPAVRPPAPGNGTRTSAAPAAPRPWRVTGLVGQRAAVLVRTDGRSMVVKIGERLDSATVVGISKNGVELQDRTGRFLLKVP